MNDWHEIAFPGLRAEKPLGFLAALGALRVASGVHGTDRATLRWQAAGEAWTPLLRVQGGSVDERQFVESLHVWMQRSSGRDAFAIGDDLTLSPQAFRMASEKAATQADAADHDHADFIAAFGCDAVEQVENGKASGKMADTAFRTMSGAGHQHFLGFMRTLAADCTPDHLQRTLFLPWRYDDPLESHTMRWDPRDDVRYALRWRDSSGDPERKRAGTMWGANRLAIEALPLFPTMPLSAVELGTVGFTFRRGDGTAWTWPVWEAHCSVDMVKTLLALPQLQASQPPRELLSRLGVAEVFRSWRIRQGKYRNLTPAQSV